MFESRDRSHSQLLIYTSIRYSDIQLYLHMFIALYVHYIQVLSTPTQLHTARTQCLDPWSSTAWSYLECWRGPHSSAQTARAPVVCACVDQLSSSCRRRLGVTNRNTMQHPTYYTRRTEGRARTQRTRGESTAPQIESVQCGRRRRVAGAQRFHSNRVGFVCNAGLRLVMHPHRRLTRRTCAIATYLCSHCDERPRSTTRARNRSSE